MLREFILQPNEDKRLQVEGRFLVITQATGPIELTIGGTTPVTVDEKDRIHLRGDSPNDRALRIKNVSGGVNAIELHTSDLLIDKRTGVDVQNSIAIQEDQRVGIDPGANIVQAVVQNPIQLDSDGNTIKIEKDQCVGIDPKKNTVKAEVQNAVGIKPDENDVKATVTNDLILKADQVIGIDEAKNKVDATLSHAVEIKENQRIGIDEKQNVVEVKRQQKAINTVSTLSFTAPDNSPPETVVTRSVAANDKRESLIVTAEPNNAAPVWLGGKQGEGTPVFPGDRLFIDGNNTLDFAALGGNTLYASEITITE